MFHQVQTWRAIRAMCTDSSLKKGHVYNHASNYLALDYQLLLVVYRESVNLIGYITRRLSADRFICAENA